MSDSKVLRANYKVSREQPHRKFISFQAVFPVEGNSVLLQLAAWRPGRYELGNFSKSIRKWKATGINGDSLNWRKLNKDIWEVDCEGLNEIVVSYEYYAPDINAGSSYIDEEQLYLNPVNCFFFLPEFPELQFDVEFDIPMDWKIGTGLQVLPGQRIFANDFDELADGPVIASASLQHLKYQCNQINFHIWIQGHHSLDVDKLISQFDAFTKAQLNLFKSIPCEQYHFLFQFTPYFVRHGVEHRNSTVIAMGPAAEFSKNYWYNELLGISCHELFHTWNVKQIRPADMLPYDFAGENYSRLGYVYEGVTTYYGDQILLRSGVFDESTYLETLEDALQKHYDNPGRRNYAVSESSFDTWLDGYVPGVPWRKVSIYTEGCLIAFICDIRLMSATSNRLSLDDVMRSLYHQALEPDYAGYDEMSYRRLLEDHSGISFQDIFEELVNGTRDYTPYLVSSLEYIGLELKFSDRSDCMASALGILSEKNGTKIFISLVEENSPADIAGLWTGDQILAVNGIEVTPDNINDAIAKGGEQWLISFLRKGREREVIVKANGNLWFPLCSVSKMKDPSEAQLSNYIAWMNRH